jgi:hypothetical protein
LRYAKDATVVLPNYRRPGLAFVSARRRQPLIRRPPPARTTSPCGGEAETANGLSFLQIYFSINCRPGEFPGDRAVADHPTPPEL